MIYALADSSGPEIKVEHLKAALALWTYCAESARYLFGDRLADPNAQKILDALKQHPEGQTRTEINDGVFQRNTSKESVDNAFETLEALGFAQKSPEETGGRRAERWFVIK